MLKRFTVLFIVLALTSVAFVIPAVAQDDMMNTLADGLANPRQMSYDSEGNLYVALAGNGGPELTPDDTPFGASAGVVMITPDGEVETVVHGLTSYREGNSLGAADVIATGDSIWVLLGETSDFTIPFTHALVELDAETGRVKTYVDLLTLELEEDPDGNDNSQSNPTDFEVAEDGTILIANAGCNCLMAWTADAGLSVAAVWSFEEDNPVPTDVEIGPDGDVYVAMLSGFPWPAEGSRIERWSQGELVETYGGLNAMTGLEVTPDGRIFAVQFGLVDGGGGPGSVVEVGADGSITAVAEGLMAPYAITSTPDGMLAVSVGSSGGEGGSIILLDMP